MKLKFSTKASMLRYFRENFGAPYIIGFQALLLVYVGLLTQGSSASVNGVAVYAYYMLAVGVVLQLVSFLRH